MIARIRRAIAATSSYASKQKAPAPPRFRASRLRCSAGRGDVSGWISFQGNAAADEIRITMLDKTAKVILHAESYNVDYVWADQ